MSVTEVVEQLRRAHARLTEARAAAVVAETTIREGREIFDHGTAGSIWPHVHEIRRLGAEAGVPQDIRKTLLLQNSDLRELNYPADEADRYIPQDLGLDPVLSVSMYDWMTRECER
ncbi:hypothetical protein FHR81_002476 [Actinoalloteichus hoggarensis]|uniref:Uncharacterized protein n=1 Tax=Actinoalloteichus hoggarensis TaxID=1470176 RepID=A0A221VWZ8_9PSEU|nr:hypothetical protein [Actinoalloteichus hoggarensis]ASO18079.1 hypothetical protein AHOG_02075 [Actinoalloteichus hoggarensis]MBB5921436.1 hypothetical protein [Actinoalloteichus hoggarensis]